MKDFIVKAFTTYPGIIEGYYTTDIIKYGITIDTHIHKLDKILFTIDSLLRYFKKIIDRDFNINSGDLPNSNIYNIPFIIATKDLVTGENTHTIFTISNFNLFKKYFNDVPTVEFLEEGNLPILEISEANEYPHFIVCSN